MHYKTITLELIHEQEELYERLRSSKRLLPSMEAYAIELKASHESWKDTMHQRQPGRDPRQVASEALELAIQELQERLHSVSPKDEAEPIPGEAKDRRRALPSE